MSSARSSTVRVLSRLLVLMIVCALALALPSVASAQPPTAAVTALRADGLTDPLGLERNPELSWQVVGGGRGVAQEAYEVRAARAREDLRAGRNLIWSTGRVASGVSAGVPYGGPALGSREEVWWQVRVWRTRGAVSGWSAPARFEAGLLAPSDWSARWITDPPPAPATTPVVLTVPAQQARFVRLDVTRLGEAIMEGYPYPVSRLQLAEIEVVSSAAPGVNLAAGAPVSTTETLDVGGTWNPRFVTDGVLTSQADPRGYTSREHRDPALATPIGVELDLGAVRSFDRVLLYPRTDVRTATGRTAGFPVDYTVRAGAASGSLTTISTVTGQVPPPPYADPGPAPLPVFAAPFDVPRTVARARLYATGLGVYEATVNGTRVSDAVLEPANTDFRERVEYGVYDVTALVRPGANAVGMALGNGMFNVQAVAGRYTKLQNPLGRPRMLAQLEITYTDGTRQTVASDPSWRTTRGPVTVSHWYGGEDHDARLLAPGWDAPGADRSSWAAAVASGPPLPTTRLSARSAPPIQVVDTVPSRAVTEPRPGVYVVDLGVNIAGWPQLRLTAPAGTTVTMRPSEILNADGTVNQSTTGSPIFDRYTAAGTGEEVWHPRFSYHGFRYVQLEGLPAAPTATTLSGLVLRAANASAGSFTSSNTVINGVHTIIDRAIQGNMFSVLTDCPHREKLGWLEETHLVLPAVMRNYDVRAYVRTLVQNMAEAQLPDGMVPTTAPEYAVFPGAFRDEVNWGSALVLTPLDTYRYYGDTQILRDFYPAMVRYAEYLQRQAGSGHLLDGGLGDWRTFDNSTPTRVTGTFGYHQVISGLAEIAGVLGNTTDATRWRTLATDIGTAFHAAYFTGGNTYASGSQASDAFALDMGIVPADRRQAVVDHLVGSIRGNGNRLTVGEIGLPSLIAALSENGRDDVLFTLASSTQNPSWGFQVVNGATSLTEDWDGPIVGNSQNHFMLGAIDEWFTAGLAGIEQAPDSVAFRKLVISPAVVGGLTQATGRYRTPYGEVLSSWAHTGSRYRLTVVVPGNSTATVAVPVDPGTVATGPDGLRPIRTEGGVSTFEIGSGNHLFTSTLAPTG